MCVCGLHYTMLHYTMLHYAILHYTTLHHATLHHATLCYTMLHYITPCYTMLHHAILRHATLRSTMLFYATLHYTTIASLHSAMLRYAYSHPVPQYDGSGEVFTKRNVKMKCLLNPGPQAAAGSRVGPAPRGRARGQGGPGGSGCVWWIRPLPPIVSPHDSGGTLWDQHTRDLLY